MDLIENVRRALDVTKNNAHSQFASYEKAANGVVKPDQLREYPMAIRRLEILLEKVTKVILKFDYSIIENEKQVYKDQKMTAWVEEGRKLEEELTNRIAAVEEEIKAKVDENNAAVQQEYEKGNAVYLELEEKRKLLEQYSDFIIAACANNGITSSDVVLDNNSYALSEWNSIYDTALDFIKKHDNYINPIRSIRDLYGRDEKVDAVVVAGLVLVSLSTILNYVAIFFLIAVFYSEWTSKKRLEQYSVLLGLLYNVRPLEMGYEAEVDKSKLLDADNEIDNDERTEEVISWYNEESEAYEQRNPLISIETEFEQLNAAIMELTKEYDKEVVEFESRKTKLVEELRDKIEDFKASFEEEKNNLKLLGDNQSDSLVYRTTYMLGLENNCMPELVDCGLQNIVIKPSKDVELQKRFVQAMVINAFCNVKPLSLTVTVVDPNDRGKDVIGIRTDDNDSNFKIDTRKMEQVIETFSEVARKNMETLRGIDIQTYNKEAEETGKTPIDYNIILVLSGAEKKEDNEALSAFMSYSAKMGIFVWVITPVRYKNCYVFHEPFEGVEHPYAFDTLRFIIDFGNKLGDRLKNSRPRGLGWGEYLEKTFKDPEDFWALSGNEFVHLEPGFVDGDPSRPDYYTVGNTGDVHGLIAGTSGSGKSVFINHLIATMTKRYGPNDLRLWLVDFKGSEFSFYLKTEDNPETLPHIDACLCTSDPEYSKTLFTAIRTMSEDRYNQLKLLQLKNMVQYNELMEKNGTPEKKWARVVMIVDEFQVIFTKADSKTIDSVNTDIALISKVARACGVHLIFASQSMKGTVSGDILNMFTLRFCLRCESDVSMSILGTPYAGQIRQKNGILYVSSIDDKKKELQKRFKTPWAPDDMLREHIKHCAEEAGKIGYSYGNVIEYNEQTKHSIDELNELYAQLSPKFEDGSLPASGTMFLGRLMVYSANKAPENIILGIGTSENLYGCFMNTKDYVNFFNSMVRNFDLWKVKPDVIYNSQSEDFHYLCHLDEIVPKKLQTLSTNKTSLQEMVNTFEMMVNVRKKSGSREKPLIFVCMGWATTVGFGIDADQRLMDKLNVMLQTAGEMNIHWIFLDSARGGVPLSVIKACKHRICGKVDEPTANALCDSAVPARPTEMPDSYAFLYSRNVMSKFKIYQSNLDRKVQEVKVVI